MSKSLYWMHGGGCGGDTWSLLNAEAPDILELFESLRIDVIWHPTFSRLSAPELQRINEKIITGKKKVDILCVEGSIIHGPEHTGMYDEYFGNPKKDLIFALAQQAEYVLAVGTCASFGGFGKDGEIQAGGLQYNKGNPGGLLGEHFRSGSGLPVVNLPGCPCHCDVVCGVLSAVCSGIELELGPYNSPMDWFSVMVHQGCTRNEYHEYRVEEKKFGEKGCMFFYMGCHGPLVYGPCNKTLWNRRSSKTRAGVPCFGCTSPEFPHTYPYFQTLNIEGIPIQLPDGVSRAHYMAYKGMAAAAAPERLIKRKTDI
ncbi:MAG: NADH:ubiquinone oxidoreductase [Desulfobacteraceae bacterium]|nr:NADH:ubiquinone oxidoreductase [Desulfobacteraceae bacterium]